MSELIGKTIGQYQIIEQIGMGGMATVFKAYQPAIDRYVAVKILPQQFAQDPNFVKRFQHEAKAIAALEHPHILPVHDFGTEGDRPYMVMRYVEGGTLTKLMGTPLTYERIVQIISNIARALNYAHQHGVVHRDIKPSNILIDQHGEVLLTDFGIAKIIEGSGATQLTSEGSILGTPAYMAPEQAGAKPVDGRSDLYSLGVILYELLTGRPPYQAETPLAVVLMHLNDPLPPPRTIKSDIPEPLERVVLKAMAKDPDQRFQTAEEMERALRQALKEVETGAPTVDVAAPITQQERPAGAKPQPAASPKRSAMGPILIGGIVLALILCLAGGGIAMWALFSSSSEDVARLTPTISASIRVTLPASQTATSTPEPSQPTSTPVPEATRAEPVATIEGLDGEIIFEDPFDSTRNGWFTGAEEDEFGIFNTDIIEGRYRLSGQAKQGLFRSEQPLNVDFDDFILSVEAMPVGQTTSVGYGVIFRVNEKGDHYTFTIDEGDSFSVSLLREGEWEGLVASRRMAAIKNDGLNQLVVKAVGPALTFYINGQEAINIKDTTLESGGIGVALELYEADVEGAVEFDNFIVRQVSEEELTTDSGNELPAPDTGGDIIFEDSFDSDANGWSTGEFKDDYTQNEVTIKEGQYYFNVNPLQPAYVEKMLPRQQFGDFILTVEATPQDSEEHYSYGIAFRENSAGHTYTFELGNDGLYAVFLFDGEWHTLKDWSNTKAIKMGETNQIAVIAKGDSLTFFVNDQELTTVKDDTLTEGEIGFLVELFEEDKPATVAFDNLVIRPVENTP